MGKTNLGRVTLVPRGAYNNEVLYKRLDIVEHEGSSYLFLKDSTGIIPTGDGEVTMLLAKRGKDFAYEDFTPEQLAALKGADGKDGINGADGTKGDKGDPGKGFTILGYYGTLDLLKAAVPTPEPGDAYGIGTAAPYDIYVFDSVTNDWVNNGKLSGGGEGGGNVVLIPVEVVGLSNASTSAEILTAFGGKDVFMSIFTQLEKGIFPMINAQGLFIPVSLFAAYPDAENNAYIIILRLTDAEILRINGYEVTNGIINIVLTNDTALVEVVDIPSGTGNDMSLSWDVFNLDSSSTSENIINAFGGIANLNNIIISRLAGVLITNMIFSDGGVERSIVNIPCSTSIQNFIDLQNYDLIVVADLYELIKIMTFSSRNGVLSLKIDFTHLLRKVDLVSDPTVGGTDKPASAEAVKIVNDKVEQGNSIVVLDVDKLTKIPPSVVNQTAPAILDLFGLDLTGFRKLTRDLMAGKARIILFKKLPQGDEYHYDTISTTNIDPLSNIYGIDVSTLATNGIVGCYSFRVIDSQYATFTNNKFSLRPA